MFGGIFVFIHRNARIALAVGIVAAGVSAAVGWPLGRLFGDPSRLGWTEAVLTCVVVGLVMLAVYVGLLRVLRVSELTDLVAPVLRRLRRR